MRHLFAIFTFTKLSVFLIFTIRFALVFRVLLFSSSRPPFSLSLLYFCHDHDFHYDDLLHLLLQVHILNLDCNQNSLLKKIHCLNHLLQHNVSLLLLHDELVLLLFDELILQLYDEVLLLLLYVSLFRINRFSFRIYRTFYWLSSFSFHFSASKRAFSSAAFCSAIFFASASCCAFNFASSC